MIPLGSPVPPSPETSAALVAAFAERGIELITGRRVAALDPARRVAVLDDGGELPFDLFLGVPKHRAPEVVIASGMTEDGYVPVDSATLETRFPGVYAVGDVATAGRAEGRRLRRGRRARRRRSADRASSAAASRPSATSGAGTCYIEFGGGRDRRASTSTSSPARSATGDFDAPSAGSCAPRRSSSAPSRRARWFGR